VLKVPFMQFKKIKRALTDNGTWVRAEIFPLQGQQRCYCPECLNPLRFRITHTEGRFFEHGLEHGDINTLERCPHLLTSSPFLTTPLPTSFEHASQKTIENDFSGLGSPRQQRYLCVLCNHEYGGLRKCPLCKHILYSTEVEKRSSETLSLKFAQ